MSTELELRARLGIPADAARVLIFGETSHWDPNWLLTSDGYYRLRIRPILDAVLDELAREPRRIYAVESLFFLRLYWEREPARREALQGLVNAGRLQLTGTGLTTPDTLLPDPEAILRDYLIGQEWLREHGMSVEPRVAYLPDDFGHSPALPSLLGALGFTQCAVTRIDGMYFVGADYRRKSAFPLAGSSAALLEQDLKTLDFVWRGPDGAEVLCHWNAFTYFQGDMLAHKGVIRWMGLNVGLPWRTTGHLAGRIAAFTAALGPLARTPYLFCPIGCDFVGPIRGLGELLARYNERCYPQTGVYAVSAGLGDYLDLVDCHRGELPTLELDPNPYWMGFYASRPEMKARCQRTARKLIVADALAVGAPPPDSVSARAGGWDLIALSNHHDFITGTSPTRTYEREQRPWLVAAEGLVDGALGHLGAAAPPAPTGPRPAWRLAGGRLAIESAHLRLVLAAADGGCIVSWRDAAGRELLAGPANDLWSYRDSGGLWRLGHEFRGGTFAPVARASESRAELHVAPRAGALEVRVESELEGRRVTRVLTVRGDSPVLRLRLDGAAARRRSITCRFPTVLGARALVMDVAGGVVRRPARKHYDPTFWPARSWAHLEGGAARPGVGVVLGGPAAIALRDRGVLEWLALRNAPHERAFGCLPLVCHPASGADHDAHGLDYAVVATPAGDYRAAGLPRLARAALDDALGLQGAAALAGIARCAAPDVHVSAVKAAHRGAGVIVRLESIAPGPCEVRLECAAAPASASLCDARERDLAPLRVDGDAVVVPVTRALTSVRLVPRE
ncbi:MAG TPA: hypothetical protein VGQ83_29080 [Polyangia bacterium]